MIVLNRSETSVGEIAMEEVEAALATAPNNSLLGSSTIRYPFPFGLWIYNGFQKYEKGFGKWIFNKFAATPVLMSTVNPDIRQKRRLTCCAIMAISTEASATRHLSTRRTR